IFRLQPDYLAPDGEFSVSEILPAGATSQLAHFSKTEGARRGKARIGFRHRLVIDCCRHQINPKRQPERSPQVGDQDVFTGKLAAFLQDTNSAIFAEMVKGERTKDDVVRF